jgi:hypothetical protein
MAITREIKPLVESTEKIKQKFNSKKLLTDVECSKMLNTVKINLDEIFKIANKIKLDATLTPDVKQERLGKCIKIIKENLGLVKKEKNSVFSLLNNMGYPNDSSVVQNSVKKFNEIIEKTEEKIKEIKSF